MQLMKRLEKARRVHGGVAPQRDEDQRAQSPIGTAADFLAALRSARHYGGAPVVSQDAPVRSRRGAPGEWLPQLRNPRGPLDFRSPIVDPGSVAEELEQILMANPERHDLLGPWARDAWLLAGDIPGALACLPDPIPGTVLGFHMDLRLTLKHLLGLRVEAREFFALYPPKLTPAVDGHLDALIEIVQDRLDAEHEAGADPLRGAFPRSAA